MEFHRAVIRGKTIELEADPGLEDGQTVEVVVRVVKRPEAWGEGIRRSAGAMAEHWVYFGTSSWKYEGWLGSVYRPERYSVRGKFSRKAFEAGCLAEYAETFPVVCGDFAFYQFPSPDYWKRLFEATPSSFLFGF